MATKSKLKNPQTQWEALKKASDYREFLSTYLEINHLSFADLARTTGFGRGFPSDVVSGRRRLTAKSYSAFENGLKLPLTGKKLFKLLVAKEEIEIFPELRKHQDMIEPWIEELRGKSLPIPHRETSKAKDAPLEKLMRNPQVISVYAAAGEPGKASSLKQICQRTQLSPAVAQSALKDLEKIGLIQQVDGLFEPKDLHLIFKANDASDVVIGLFKQACQMAAQRSAVAMTSNEELFFASRFCIDQARLPELKKSLRELILKFIDESIKADGDRVVHLATTLHL